MVNFKTVNNSDAGTSTKHGGNDADRVSQLLNGLPDIAPNLDINTQMRIRSGRLELRNAANSFSYNILGAALTANRNLYLPLLAADDTLVTLNLAQELTNKVISGASNTITDIPDSALPAGMVYEDMPSTFSEPNTFLAPQKFEDYNEVKAIAAPTNPAAGLARLYLDTADNKYKIKKSDGTIVDLELSSGGGGADERVMVKEDGVPVSVSAHKLNFVVPTDFDFTEDVANDEIDMKIANDAIANTHIVAHTSTKISVLTKPQLHPDILYSDMLNFVTDAMLGTFTQTKLTTTDKALLSPAIVYNDQNNDFGAFYQDFDQIPEPSDPAAGTRRVFVDLATGKLSTRTSAGVTVSLEEQGGGGAGGWTEDGADTNYTDYDLQATAPANPSTDQARIYMKDIDANNQGIFAKVKKAGAFVEVQIF